MDHELTELMKENNRLLRALTVSVKQLVELAIEHIKTQEYQIEGEE